MHTVILENGHEAKCIDKGTVSYNGLHSNLLHVGDGSFIVRTEKGIIEVIGCIEKIKGHDIKTYWSTVYGYELLMPFIDRAFREGWQESAIAFHCYSGTCFVETEKDCWLIAEGNKIMSLPSVTDMKTFIRERDQD